MKNLIRCASLALLLAVVATSSANADSDFLHGGVLVPHHPAGLEYSAGEPPLGGNWCDYFDSTGTSVCGQINPRVPANSGEVSSVWYVLVAWEEPKEWAGVAFGLGEYPDSIYTFIDWGVCSPCETMEIVQGNWPGSQSGTSVVCASGCWSGNYRPIYYFAGYGYSIGEIPLEGTPLGDHPVCCILDNTAERRTWDVPPQGRGILGIGRDGAAPCPTDSVRSEVLVHFGKGSIAIPSGNTHATVRGAGLSAETETLLTQSNVIQLRRLFPDFDRADTLAVSRTHETIRLTDWSRYFACQLSDSLDRDNLADELVEMPGVLAAQSNTFAASLCAYPQPEDALYEDQWYLENTGQEGGTEGVDIGARRAWDITRGDPNVTVALLDLAFSEHEDLLSQHGGCPCLYGGPFEGCGHHGYAMAGLIAANHNSIGIAGLSPASMLVCYGLDIAFWTQDPALFAQAITEASVLNRRPILNCSWGAPANAFVIRDAVIDAYKMNALAVAAGGMYNCYPWDPQVSYPAGYLRWVTGVGATDRNDELWEFGPCGPHIDVVAPGVDIVTLMNPLEDPYEPYGVGSGPSAAAALVSATASLLLARNPDLYNDDLDRLIKMSALVLGEEEFDIYSGYGRIRADEALKLLDPLQSTFVQQVAFGADSVGAPVDLDAQMIGVPDWEGELWTDAWQVKMYEVRKDVSFGGWFTVVPEVWGRGVATTGLHYAENDEVLGSGYCEPVDGTITTAGCTLRTWVYKDRDYEWWWPCKPEDVVFAYSLCAPEPENANVDDSAQGLPETGRLWVSGWSDVRGGVDVVLVMPAAGVAKVEVVDVAGRLVRLIVEAQMDSGRHLSRWDGRDAGGQPVRSGVYFVRGQLGNSHLARKIVVMR